MRLRIATRQSALALAQTSQFVKSMQAQFPDLEYEIVRVVTQGDRVIDKPLVDIGGKGLFIKEIEQVLRRGEADCALHSMKDLPADIHEDFVIISVPRREDPRDVIVMRTEDDWMSLKAGARIATGSLRRIRQLERLRNDVAFVPIRGNIDTRLRKLESHALDALVLAAAGLKRLGVWPAHAMPLSVNVCVPSAGQGALAVEILRKNAMMPWAQALHATQDALTRLCVEAERVCVSALGGDCTMPVGVYASIPEQAPRQLHMTGFLAERDSAKFKASTACCDLELGAGVTNDVLQQVKQCGRELAKALVS